MFAICEYLSRASRDVTVAYIISHIHRQNLGKFRHGAMGSWSNVYVLGINVIYKRLNRSEFQHHVIFLEKSYSSRAHFELCATRKIRIGIVRSFLCFPIHDGFSACQELRS